MGLYLPKLILYTRLGVLRGEMMQILLVEGDFYRSKLFLVELQVSFQLDSQACKYDATV